MPVSQSSARRHWPQNAQQGPPPMGQPQSPPEPLQRSRAASPSPAPACCRSPSADVSATLHGQPACPLASPACPQDPLPTPGSLPVPWHPLRVLRIPACPWGLYLSLASPAFAQVLCLSQGLLPAFQLVIVPAEPPVGYPSSHSGCPPPLSPACPPGLAVGPQRSHCPQSP